MKALAALYGKVIGRDIDPFAEVLVTAGGMEALFSVISAHIDEGDEVIIVEPFFASYEPIIRLANGIVRYVQLKLVSFSLFLLETCITTKNIVKKYIKCLCRWTNGQMALYLQVILFWMTMNYVAHSTRKPK